MHGLFHLLTFCLLLLLRRLLDLFRNVRCIHHTNLGAQPPQEFVDRPKKTEARSRKFRRHLLLLSHAANGVVVVDSE